MEVPEQAQDASARPARRRCQVHSLAERGGQRQQVHPPACAGTRLQRVQGREWRRTAGSARVRPQLAARTRVVPACFPDHLARYCIVESEGATVVRSMAARATVTRCASRADAAGPTTRAPPRSLEQLRSLRLLEIGSVLTQRRLHAHPSLEELRVEDAKSMSHEDVQVSARVHGGANDTPACASMQLTSPARSLTSAPLSRTGGRAHARTRAGASDGGPLIG